MKYKILATDLDGTLNNDNHEVSKDNQDAINRAIEKGIHLVLCSGRSPISLNNYAIKTGLNKKGCYSVGFNGGVVYEADTMKVLYECRLSRENALKAIDVIKSIDEDAPVIVYLDANHIIYEKQHENIELYAQFVKIKTEQVDSFKEAINKDVIKILVRWDVEGLKKIYKGAEGKVLEYSSMFYSDKHLLEFGPIGCSKSKGLEVLSGILGSDMSEVVCIGDYHNDLEMVRDAGLGIAVQNAVDELKAVAKYVTKADNNNSAIKEVVDMILE